MTKAGRQPIEAMISPQLTFLYFITNRSACRKLVGKSKRTVKEYAWATSEEQIREAVGMGIQPVGGGYVAGADRERESAGDGASPAVRKPAEEREKDRSCSARHVPCVDGSGTSL